jgi:hypothetical protein
MTSIAPSPPRYRPQCAWPHPCDVRFGENGLVVTRSSSGSVSSWYFEATLRESGQCFHAEGASPIAAELECFSKFQRALVKVATHREPADAVAG